MCPRPVRNGAPFPLSSSSIAWEFVGGDGRRIRGSLGRIPGTGSCPVAALLLLAPPRLNGGPSPPERPASDIQTSRRSLRHARQNNEGVDPLACARAARSPGSRSGLKRASARKTRNFAIPPAPKAFAVEPDRCVSAGEAGRAGRRSICCLEALGSGAGLKKC